MPKHEHHVSILHYFFSPPKPLMGQRAPVVCVDCQETVSSCPERENLHLQESLLMIHHQSHMTDTPFKYVCLEKDCFAVFDDQATFVEHKAECFAHHHCGSSFDATLNKGRRIPSSQELTEQMTHFYANFTWRKWEMDRRIGVLHVNDLFIFY